MVDVPYKRTDAPETALLLLSYTYTLAMVSFFLRQPVDVNKKLNPTKRINTEIDLNLLMLI
jgi:hypothetical protein